MRYCFYNQLLLFSILSVGFGASTCAQPPQRPGWQPTWFDEFQGNSVNTVNWQVITSDEPTNNSLHAYEPSQVTVANGNLVITSENIPSSGLPYRSGQVISKANRRQQYGRWDVRAKLPTSTGMWPAIWLLPPVAQHGWPSQGEIDIMENRGTQSNLTSSAFHYGTHQPFSHSFVYGEQQAFHGSLQNYHDSFHTYSVEWEPTQLRFYVDGVHHYSVHDSMVGGFLSNQTAGMDTVINTAVGGTFLQDPDGTTVWPQQFLIDHVYVYEATPTPAPLTFDNGSFDERFDGVGPGTLTEWSTFGNTEPNVQTASKAVLSGPSSLKLYGQFNGSNLSGVEQGISVASGDEVRAITRALVRSADSIAGTNNELLLKIDYYSSRHGQFGSGDYISSEEITIADGSTANDTWHEDELRSVAPAGAVEARLALVFRQINNGGGAVHVDDILFGKKGDYSLTWDGLGDGDWNTARWMGAPLDVPTDFDRAIIQDNRVRVAGTRTAFSTTVDSGTLELAGTLVSDVEVQAGAEIVAATDGSIDGDLQLQGALLIEDVSQTLVVTGGVDVTDAELVLSDSYSQARGTLTGLQLLLTGDSVIGTMSTTDDEHLGNGYFLDTLLRTSAAVAVDIYSAIPGDANGDRTVDGQDFIIWNNSKFQSGTDWLSGDFNGDGITDGSDFIIWNNFKFTSVDYSVNGVPEPAQGLAMPLLLVLLGARGLRPVSAA